MSRRQIIHVVLFIAILTIFIWKSGPLLLALLTALLLEPIVRLMGRVTRLRRIWASSITFTIFLLVFLLCSYWVVTTLFVQSIQLAERLPQFSEHVMTSIREIVEQSSKYYDLIPADAAYTMDQVLSSIQKSAIAFASGVGKWVLGILAGIPELLLGTIIYLIGLFLISLDLPGIQSRFLNLFTVSAKEKVELVISKLNRAALGFLGAQLFLSALTYLQTFVGLFILGINYAAIISLLITLIDVLPVIGASVVLIPWSIILFINGQTKLAVGMLILCIIITIVRRILEPKVLGTSLGISPLAAFASMFIGFKLIGVFGLIAGPALVIVVQALLNAGFLNVKIDF